MHNTTRIYVWAWADEAEEEKRTKTDRKKMFRHTQKRIVEEVENVSSDDEVEEEERKYIYPSIGIPFHALL